MKLRNNLKLISIQTQFSFLKTVVYFMKTVYLKSKYIKLITEYDVMTAVVCTGGASH